MTPDLIKQRLGQEARPNWGHSDYDLTPDALRSEHPLRPAAVLVPIVDRRDGPTVLLTRRTAHLSSHAGQISFPGGRMEADDPSPEATALRETEEEVGIAARHIDIVGRLDTYRTVTNYAVTPIVAIVQPEADVKADPYEVAEIFETPLSFLLDPGNHHRHSGWFNGHRRRWWAMPWGDYYIWGATAGMLMNLHERLKD